MTTYDGLMRDLQQLGYPNPRNEDDMTTTKTTPDAQCAQHAGEPWPARHCVECDAAAREATATPHLERRVRSHDPDTSWDAATITSPDANEVRVKVLAIVAARGPLTDDEIFSHYRASGGIRTAQRVRTARAELSRPVIGDPILRELDREGVSATGAAARRWVLA